MAMASTMKPWREAATLILTAHLGRTTVAASQFTKPTTGGASSQHPGAADLVVDKSYIKKSMTPDSETNGFARQIKPISFDYSTLLLTRNVRRNTFFAGAHVFPGGALDKAEFSSTWMELFAQAGFKRASDFGELVSGDRDKPPILLKSRDGSPVPPDVAFRICAIRETFEESGILLLRSIKDCDPHKALSSVPYATTFLQLTDTEVKSWRDAVHNDASKFIDLCRNFDALPDIWALTEWSNWLTPSDNIPKKRFDTMFYICSLDRIPHTQHDETETTKSEWMTPIDALTKYCNEELYLPPPQIYELMRFCRYGQQRALHQFVSDRAFLGTQRYLPVRMNSADGLMSLLPGDDLYPDEPVLDHLKPDEIRTTEQTVKEASRSCQNHHRFEFRTVNDYDMLCDIELPHGHIGPMQIFEDDLAKSKL